ncbi:cobalamin-binding protein [Lacisediminimonas sp.]|uniref:cobalamin-binding protein n=1 Tax=Lacisediminimonas sp. TaxID=3060582 RepID=UPI002715D9F2|nr:cobalamin-binding protein [Lacisediminimonas sp.]MDO8298321.1 cobalamin-binding protein [Lacisediminimonas sp.]
MRQAGLHHCLWQGQRRLLCGLLALALLALAAAAGPAQAQVQVIDDAGRTVSLSSPARRIVSLAPHATELLFAVGAGSSVAGVIEYSDFPREARAIASVGSAAAFDIERIAALRPQLIVAWGSGNNPVRLQQLQDLGYPVFISEPRDFETIATSLERLSILAGTASAGRAAATQFRRQVRELQERYRNRPPVRVFYQVWRSPLMTLNNEHLVSQAMAICGGSNVFAHLPQLAPTIGIEDVLLADPTVIINASGRADDDGLQIWQRFPRATAVRLGNLFTVDADTLTRATPRILEGTQAICRALDIARSKR